MVKYRQSIKKGKSVPPDFKYLGSDKPISSIDVKDSTLLLQLLGLVIIRIADNVLELLPKYNDNWEKVATELALISKLNCYRAYVDTALEASKTADPSVLPVLSKVINLWANYVVKEYASSFLKYGLINKDKLTEVEVNIFNNLLPFLRTQIVGLTDAFQLNDFLVNSPLGAYDGDFYNKYFDQINLVNNNNSEYDTVDYKDEILGLLNRPSVDVREFNEKSEEALTKLGK